MKFFSLLAILSSLINTSYAGAMGAVEDLSNFGGLYAGVGTGLISVFTNDTFSTVRSDGFGGDVDSNKFTDTSVLFTGNVGYGWMFNQKAYFGAKGSIYYTPLKQLNETGFSTAAGDVLIVGHNSINRSLQPIYNIDLVLGYEALPHFLPFVEAGVSFSNVQNYIAIKRTRANIATGANVGYTAALDINNYRTGYNVGIGANYLVHTNWMFFSELVYNGLGKPTEAATVAIPGTGTTETHRRTENSNAVSLFAGVSYLFPI